MKENKLHKEAVLFRYKTASLFLCVTAAILFIIILYGLASKYRIKSDYPYLAVELFEEILYDKDLYKTLPKYLITSENENTDLGDAGLTRDVITFEYILGDGWENSTEFEIISWTDSMLELVLINDGQKQYPCIIFYFNMSEDNKYFIDYILAREQPYSRLDEEYSELWND